MLKQLLSSACLLLLLPQISHAERYQVGIGIARQRLNTKSFQNSVDESRGHFDFTSLELRGAYAFASGDSSTLSLEGQFHNQARR